MKPPRPILISAYGLTGFAAAFLFIFWLLFRWLHYGYTKWLVDSGDWAVYDGTFSIMFGLLVAAIPYSVRLAYPVEDTNRRPGVFRALLWLVAAVVFFGLCFYYQHSLEGNVKGPTYPDSILFWPVLYYLAIAIATVVLMGWAVGRKHVGHAGEKYAA